jgi:hypothetical protein
MEFLPSIRRTFIPVQGIDHDYLAVLYFMRDRDRTYHWGLRSAEIHTKFVVVMRSEEPQPVFRAHRRADAICPVTGRLITHHHLRMLRSAYREKFPYTFYDRRGGKVVILSPSIAVVYPWEAIEGETHLYWIKSGTEALVGNILIEKDRPIIPQLPYNNARARYELEVQRFRGQYLWEQG